MCERVFVDVGAHAGNTARAVFGSRFEFDRVISVEPDPKMVAALETAFASEISNGRFVVAPYAVSKARGAMQLYGSNARGGASLVAGKVPKSQRTGFPVDVISWGDLLEKYNLRGAKLYVKMNCEGGEVDVVESMIEHDRGEIASMVIDYDIVKSAWGGWKKWASVAALRRASIPFLLSECVFVKGAKRSPIDNWLGGLREFSHPVVKRTPINLHQYARIKYIEVISALGVKHDFARRR